MSLLPTVGYCQGPAWTLFRSAWTLIRSGNLKHKTFLGLIPSQNNYYGYLKNKLKVLNRKSGQNYPACIKFSWHVCPFILVWPNYDCTLIIFYFLGPPFFQESIINRLAICPHSVRMGEISKILNFWSQTLRLAICLQNYSQSYCLCCLIWFLMSQSTISTYVGTGLLGLN